MKRRSFITLLSGAAAVWPLAARAQERVRRIAVLLPASSDNAVFQAWVQAFVQGLALLGWTIGRNVRIDTRWATDAADVRRHAAELAALAPDVILAHGASSVTSLLQVTRTVPIVFPTAVDPVGAGIVDSLARPGGNATGFSRRRLSRQDSARSQTGRHPGRTADQIRTRHQSDDRQGTRPDDPGLVLAARRRGD